MINTTSNAVKQTIPVGGRDIYGGDLSSSGIIYVANSDSNTVFVINTTTNIVTENIPVGEFPLYIYGDPDLDAIYVINAGSDIVSVINTTSNIVTENIPVGEFPLYIYGDPDLDAIYVANSDSNTVSVINTTSNIVTENIPVGESPMYIYGDPPPALDAIYEDPDLGAIYVANSHSNTVSVINTTTNILTENIPVGEFPSYIYGDPDLDAIYVANSNSDGVSVINSVTNELVAGVIFDIKPFGTGDIVCDAIDAPINRFFYVSPGTKCIAKPSKGFEFSSWGEILDGNATRTINASTTSGSPLTAFLDIFNFKSNDPASILTANQFGNFTAYFRALPPAIPSEYWIPLYGIVVRYSCGMVYSQYHKLA